MTVMWFPLALLALSMLVARRSVEKGLSGKVDSLALAWLQQAFALPFIFATLWFATFYWPAELSAQFWVYTSIYAVCGAIDLFLYFKALSLADVSYVAPLLALTGVGAIAGSVVILHQAPTMYGVVGALLVVAGTIVIHRAKQGNSGGRHNVIALWLVLGIVVLRALYSNIELFPLRESNPTTFNFYSSLLTVPVLLVVTVLVQKRRDMRAYWHKVRLDVRKSLWLLAFVGLTYTINLTATYQAKLLSPTAGYVTSVKSAQVVPMMLLGAWLFREKVNRWQWFGLAIICCGLVLLGLS